MTAKRSADSPAAGGRTHAGAAIDSGTVGHAVEGKSSIPSTTDAAGVDAIRIHRACLDDIDEVAPLFDAYRRFYGQPRDLDRARDWLRDRIGRGESVVLVARRGTQAVGFTQLYPMFSSVRTARTWILNDLFVAPEARRGGVARALLDAAAGFARADGAAGIALETTRDNTAARALYRAAGWHEDDTHWYSLAFPRTGPAHG